MCLPVRFAGTRWIWYSLVKTMIANEGSRGERMLQHFIPDYQVNTIYEINIDELLGRGIKGIITDLDNTLVGAKVPLATPELINWLKLVQTAGLKVVIVSNNNQARVGAFADPLGIPYVHSARKPGNRAFLMALDLLGLKPSEALMVGDQMMTDVFGGNRMGLHTMLVKPISIRDEGVMTRVNRRLEKIVIARLKKKGYTPWEERQG